MRAAVLLSVVLLSVAACQGPKGDPGPAGPPGPTGLTGATGPKSEGVDVPALMARVDMLEKKLAAAKVPHLVVKATGEDLGPSLGGFCFYSAAVDGEVCLQRTVVLFENQNCTGRAFVRGAPFRRSTLFAGPSTYYRSTAVAGESSAKSQVDLNGKCDPIPETRLMTSLVDTGAPIVDRQLNEVEIAAR